jgi:hypothetical protein
MSPEIADSDEPAHMNLFRKHNYLMTYGDDNSSSSSKLWFDQIRLRDTLLEFNIQITSASKDDKLTPFVTEQEMTFLKRGFNPVTLSGKQVVLCPLDEDSIARSIMFTATAPEIRKGVEASNIVDAQKQWFFHGEEVFNDRIPALREMADGAGIDLSIVNGKWYSFNEIADEYLKGTLVTNFV